MIAYVHNSNYELQLSNMKSRLKEKEEAISLRKQGFSYKEIMEKVSVSKSSLSGWFKYLVHTEEESALLAKMSEENSESGRARATVSNRERRIERESTAFKAASLIYEQHKNDPQFVLGVGLYWAEGGKRTSNFQFVNSDIEMMKFMIHWVQKYLNVNKSSITLRLSTHAEFVSEGYEQVWSHQTGIPLTQFHKTSYKPNRHGIYKKNPLYKGCGRMEIGGGMSSLRLMLGLQKALVETVKVLY
jgi:hypothetical protein